MSRCLAIDLGSHTVKVASWKVNRGKVEFDRRASWPVEQDGERPGVGPRVAALAELFAAEPDLRPKAGDLVASDLPGDLVTMHRLSMPFVDRAQVERTLPFAVEAEVPFDLAEMSLAWRAWTVEAKSQVMVGLVRREVLRTWLEALDGVGADPALFALDVEVLGTLLPAPGPEMEPGPAVAVVDVGHNHTSISVVVDGRVVWCRALDVGGQAFTRAIAVSLGIPFAEAEKLKHGTVEEPTEGGRKGSGYAQLPAPARTAVDAAIGWLLAEIRTSLIQAEDALGREIGAVHLTGGGARIEALWGYLATDLGVPVRPLEDADLGAMGPDDALVLGLGRLITARNPELVLDLRVGDLAWRGGSDLVRNVVTYGAAGFGTFVAAAMILFGIQLRGLSQEQAEVEGRIFETVTSTFPDIDAASLTDAGTAAELMAGLTEDAVHRADVLGDGGGLPPTVDVLEALFVAMPSIAETPVEISELTVTPTNISFQAEADGYATSSATEEKLKAHPRFKAAEKGEETKLANGRVRFPISISLEEVEEPADTEAEGPPEGDAPAEAPTPNEED